MFVIKRKTIERNGHSYHTGPLEKKRKKEALKNYRGRQRKSTREHIHKVRKGNSVKPFQNSFVGVSGTTDKECLLIVRKCGGKKMG